MPHNQEKIRKFLQAVTDHAAAQSRQLHAEVEIYKQERLSKAEEQALAESTELIGRELEALQKDIRLESSRREFNARRQLLEKRREMTETIFEEAREKLIAFTEDAAYTTFLHASVQAIGRQLPAEGTVYFAAQRDEKRKEQLAAWLPADAPLQFVSDITIGGIRAYHAPSGRIVDDTLDTRLEEQREWFVDTSGLTVE